MKIFFSTIAMVMILLTSCAQKPIAIKAARAFFTVSSPGNVMTAESGEEVPRFEVERYLFIELKAADNLKITSVAANGKKFKTQTEKIKGATLMVGSSFLNNSQQKISVKPGNVFWKVWLISENEKPIVTPLKNIVVKGMSGTKAFVFNFEKETELQGPMRY